MELGIHWGGAYINSTILEPMNNEQRLVIRNVYNIKKYDRVSYTFAENTILTVKLIYIYFSLTFLQKNISLFKFKTSTRNFRCENNLLPEKPKYIRETSRRQAYYSITDICNANNSIDLYNKTNTFKRKLKENILSSKII